MANQGNCPNYWCHVSIAHVSLGLVNWQQRVPSLGFEVLWTSDTYLNPKMKTAILCEITDALWFCRSFLCLTLWGVERLKHLTNVQQRNFACQCMNKMHLDHGSMLSEKQLSTGEPAKVKRCAKQAKQRMIYDKQSQNTTHSSCVVITWIENPLKSPVPNCSVHVNNVLFFRPVTPSTSA